MPSKTAAHCPIGSAPAARSSDASDSDADAAYLVLGPLSGQLDLGAADAKLTGEASDDRAGRPVSGAGDIDGDGWIDLLVGAYGEDAGGSSAGAPYLVLGSASGSDRPRRAACSSA